MHHDINNHMHQPGCADEKNNLHNCSIIQMDVSPPLHRFYDILKVFDFSYPVENLPIKCRLCLFNDKIRADVIMCQCHLVSINLFEPSTVLLNWNYTKYLINLLFGSKVEIFQVYGNFKININISNHKFCKEFDARFHLVREKDCKKYTGKLSLDIVFQMFRFSAN